MAPASIADYHHLAPKFNSDDPDIRFMTLVDLGRLLDNTPQATLAREQSVCSMIVDNLIKLLDDTNGDVQNQALKCIKPFTFRAPPEMLIPFMQKIVNLETSKSQDASITSTAARTLVLSLPQPTQGSTASRQVGEAFNAVSQVLLPKLLGTGLKSSSSNNNKPFITFESQKGVSIESLDLLSEVVHCYGSLMIPAQLDAIEAILMKILSDINTGPIAKKRASLTLAKLCTWFSDDELSAFVSRLVEDFRQQHLTEPKHRVLISVLGAIARTIPTKFGPYLLTLAPFVLGVLSQQEFDGALAAIAEDESPNDDLKEAALMALEDFVLSCSAAMRSFTTEIIEAGHRSLMYDPMLDPDANDDMKDDDDDFEIEDEDYEQEEQFDDDDDSSWKIRKSAARLFYSLISTRSDLIDSSVLHETILPSLIKGFKDREESVQLEALLAVTLIIRNTAATVSIAVLKETTSFQESGTRTRKRRRVDSTAGAGVGALSDEDVSRGYASPAANLPSPTSGPKTELLLRGHDMATAAIDLLVSPKSSGASKQAAIILLKAFVHLKHDSLVGLLDRVVQPVAELAVTGQVATSQSMAATGIGAITTGSLRIEAIQLLGLIFDTHSSMSVASFADQAIKAVATSVDDRNLKVANEALNAAESIIKALTPPRSFGYDKKSQQYTEQIFSVVLEKAQSNEADLEVRERAIQAVGVCIARTANTSFSVDQRQKALGFLHERLANETTRLSATLAIDLILTNDQTGQLDSQWLAQVASELGSHLKKADRRVRSASLSAIKKLTANSASKRSLDKDSLDMLTQLVLQAYKTDGLANIVLTTEILSDLVSISPQTVVDDAFNKTISDMVVQPLGGHMLDSFLELITSIGSAGVGTSLMNELLQNVSVQGDPQVVGTTIGTLLASGGSTIPVKIDSFISEIQSKTDDRRMALALIVLGETGSILGSESKISPDIFVQSLQSKPEIVQAAAATSLGRCAASNTQVFIPVLFDTIQKMSSNRVLGLLAIKELLLQTNRSNSNTNVAVYSQQLWDILIKMAATDENRPLTAECIGRLAAMDIKYFPSLYDHLNNTKPGVRGAIIQAVRFAVGDADDASDEALRPYLVKMLVIMLQDSNIENKRLAMATLQSAARNKPRLVLASLPQLLPYVVKSSELDPSLIREVQMGPFKHKVDDGLEMRKGAYEALHAFMDLAYQRMDHAELFDRVIAGLQDDHDIKMLVFLMLRKLIDIDKQEVARRLDIIAERFQAILATRLKENAVKQEVEKLKEITKEVIILTIRLRNEYADTTSPSAATGQAFRSYLEFVKRDYAAQIQAAEAEARVHV